MADDETSKALKWALWNAFTNMHYHGQREGCLDLIDRLITFCTLCAGAAVVVTSLDARAQYIMAAAVTIFGIVQLVFSIGPTARKHASFREKYSEVASDLAASRITPAEANAKMLQLAGTEGPIYSALHALSENWAKSLVYGREAPELCKISGVRRLLRHIWRQGDHDFHG